jgi:hypothetical protein
LAFGASPVDGHDPQSFCSKGQGMLSLVCVLTRLKTWTTCQEVLTGMLATDNSGLVDQAREQSQLKYSVPNTSFQLDWDVVEAIVKTVLRSKMEVTYTYVWGHQDKNKSYTQLPFLAHLNVDANKYAGCYQTAHIRQWINTNQQVILKSAKEAKINSLLHVCPINTKIKTIA